MTKGSFKRHNHIVAKYRHPTDDMLTHVGFCTDDIISVHYELPLVTMFSDYGCYSVKTPDIVYQTRDVNGNFFYVGEIKSGESIKSIIHAVSKSKIYSSILDNYSIPHKSFVVTGIDELAYSTYQLYDNYIKTGYYGIDRPKQTKQHKKKKKNKSSKKR